MTRHHLSGVRRWLTVGVTAACAALAITAGSAGCAAKPAPKPARPKHFDGQFSNTINYESFGTTAAVDCADGKSLNVVGSNNKLTVHGRCDAVSVGGADNRITVERVDKSLTLTGLNNSVTYRAGNPVVDDRGSGNSIVDRH